MVTLCSCANKFIIQWVTRTKWNTNSTQNPLKWQHKNTAVANADHKVTNNGRKLILRSFFFCIVCSCPPWFLWKQVINYYDAHNSCYRKVKHFRCLFNYTYYAWLWSVAAQHFKNWTAFRHETALVSIARRHVFFIIQICDK